MRPAAPPHRAASTSLRPRRRAALPTADAVRHMAAHITTQRQQPGEGEGAGAQKVAELQAKARPLPSSSPPSTPPTVTRCPYAPAYRSLPSPFRIPSP